MTTTKQQHSPVPWTYRWNPEDTGEGLVAACGQAGEGVYCEEKLFLWERPQEELEANARLIVRAVNNYEALLGALKECIEAFRLTREYVGEATLPAIEGWSWFDADTKARAAIAAAEAQP